MSIGPLEEKEEFSLCSKRNRPEMCMKHEPTEQEAALTDTSGVDNAPVPLVQAGPLVRKRCADEEACHLTSSTGYKARK